MFSKINDLNIKDALTMKIPSPYKNQRDIDKIVKLDKQDLKKNYYEIQKLATTFNDRNTDFLICSAVQTSVKMTKYLFGKDLFDEIIYVEYETIKLPIPSKYNEILTIQYGNYMQFPPLEQRVNKHGHCVFNPDISYRDYFNKVKEQRSKKVLTYGTFDLFHYGHYNLLKRAKDFNGLKGNILFVGVSSDQMCRNKGKVPYLLEEKRVKMVSNLRFVDAVFIENNMHQKVNDAKKYGIDIFLLGSDYKDIFPKMPEYQELKEIGCETVFLERTPDISTSGLKKKVIEQSELDKNVNSIHNLTNKE